MPAALNPQLDPTLTGIDALAAAGRPQPLGRVINGAG
jgi:hypothetical protein